MAYRFNPFTGRLDDVAQGVAAVAGSGTATQVAYWATASTITSDAGLYWNSGSSRLGIGHSTPQAPLHVLGVSGAGEGIVALPTAVVGAFHHSALGGGGDAFISLMSGTAGTAGIFLGDKDSADVARLEYNNFNAGLSIYVDNGDRILAFNSRGEAQFANIASVPSTAVDQPRVNISAGGSTIPSLTAEAGRALLLQNNSAVGDDVHLFLLSGTSGEAGILFGDTAAIRRGFIQYDHAGDDLELGTAATERFRVGPLGQWGIGGATYGTAGQAFLSGGAGAAPTWGAPVPAAHTHDHGSEITGLLDDDHTQYLLLAGRATGQVAKGGTASGEILKLQGTNDAVAGPVRVNDVTHTHTTGVFADLQVGGIPTFNGGTRYTWLELGQLANVPRVFNVTTTPIGTAVGFQPSVRNTTPGSAVDLGSWLLFANLAQFRTNNTAGVTMTELRTFADSPTFNQITGGTLAATTHTSLDCRPTYSTGATVTTRRGVRFLAHSGSGVQTDVIGFDYEAQTAGGINVAFRNQDSAAEIRSAGTGIFGADAARSGAGAALEVQSTTQALLLSRMSAAQKAAVTALNGMVLYDTDSNRLNARQNGAWVEFQPLDAGLTALSSQGSGIAVCNGSDGWFARSLTQPAAGLTISPADGVSGNPVFALADDLAAVENLSGTGIVSRTGTSTWDTTSGTAGQVLYWTSATAPTSSANLFWNTGASRLGIGTNLPIQRLHLEEGIFFSRRTGTGATELFQLHQPDLTNNNDLRLVFFGDTTTASLQKFSQWAVVYSDHTHATRTGYARFQTTSSGVDAVRASIGQPGFATLRSYGGIAGNQGGVTDSNSTLTGEDFFFLNFITTNSPTSYTCTLPPASSEGQILFINRFASPSTRTSTVVVSRAGSDSIATVTYGTVNTITLTSHLDRLLLVASGGSGWYLISGVVGGVAIV